MERRDNDKNIEPISQTVMKKRKLNVSSDPALPHSSLGYSSFKAPPIVEYNSIDSYCEKNLGKSLLPSHDVPSQSAPSLSNVKSISGPIELKSPSLATKNKILANSDEYEPPFSFFSVEELSMVKSLSHWTNTKVCPVGIVEFDISTQECSLHSVLEKGSWQLLLDTSLLIEIPKLKTVLQLFGYLEVVSKKPVLKVCSYRNMRSADVNLFVSSYRMMQNYIPNFVLLPESNTPNEVKSPPQVRDSEGRCELNDTLDGFNFSKIEDCINCEVGNK